MQDTASCRRRRPGKFRVHAVGRDTWVRGDGAGWVYEEARSEATRQGGAQSAEMCASASDFSSSAGLSSSVILVSSLTKVVPHWTEKQAESQHQLVL